MEGSKVQNVVAKTMGYVLYLVIFVMVCGFVVKLSGNQTSGLIPQNGGLSYVVNGIKTGQSDAIFALGAYITALSPILFSTIIFIGYLLEKRYKASLLGLSLIIALALSFFIKSV